MTAPSSSSSAARWTTAAVAIAIALLTLLVFLPVRTHDFLNWDDQSYVIENDQVKGGLTSEGILWAFTRSHSANWHPVTWISHMLDCQVYGLQPGGHHLTNVLIHSVNAALLFLLLRRLTGSRWRSTLVAVIFAVHPLRVESVAWVSERKDGLSLFFGLLCLMAYACWVQSKRQKAKPESIWYGAALVLFALGLMSKPMLITWPFVMLLLDYWPLGRVTGNEWQVTRTTWQRLLIEKMPFFALAVASGIVTILAQKHGGAVASFEHLPPGLRLQNAAVAYVEYLGKLFWPLNLSPIYPHPNTVAGWQWIGAVALLAGITASAWWLRRRFPFAPTGWLWFLGTLVPVIGIVQVGSQAMADRYTYIPLIGVVWALVWLGGELVTKAGLPRMAVGVISAGIVAALGWRTTAQLTYWRNTETLFRYTLTLSPNSVQALFGLGSYAVDHGQTQEGKKLLEQAIQLQPTFADAIGTLASVLDGEGRYAEAVRYYQDALKAQPDHPGVLNNLAWLRAACADAKFRDGQQAVQLATRACELTEWSKPLFIGTLAAAQAETGDFQAAIATGERAATLASALGLPDTAERNHALIELYRQGKAAHGGPPGAER